MAKISDATFRGQSGQEYAFEVWPMDQGFKAVAGVYAVTKRFKNSNGGYTHTIIYYGETENLSTRFDNHHKAACFTRHGATCICTHRDNDADSRLAKEADLIRFADPSCND
jgi:hypothetical protein